MPAARAVRLTPPPPPPPRAQGLVRGLGRAVVERERSGASADVLG